MIFLVLGVHILSLVCCDLLISSNDTFEHVSNNQTESSNNTDTDIEHWRSDIGMSVLEAHLQEFLHNMTEENSSAANASHLARAINATTDTFTDEFLATLTYQTIQTHSSDQIHRIDNLCSQSKFSFRVCNMFYKL